ncbi:MAG: type II secretion system protein, partial [Chloroflexota bacterium]|nr:type II secretion system protein [Chloroflexota bacterium]
LRPSGTPWQCRDAPRPKNPAGFWLESAGFRLGFGYMKAKGSKRRQRALTFIELLLVIFELVVLAGLFLPSLSSAKRKSQRINCVNHLAQVSLGLRMWANDNDDKYPMQVSTNKRGSLEWIESKDVYRHFMAASNEIASPKVLRCPEDLERSRVATFPDLSNKSLSYFLNLSASEKKTSVQLFIGDRHLTHKGIQYSNGSYLIPTQQVLTWGKKPHRYAGNIGLSDGSVQQVSARSLQSAILNTQSPTNWLAFP